jgi:hypothetical protein
VNEKHGRSGLVRLGRWLGPTLIGPVLGAWLLVTAHAFVTGAGLASVLAELALTSMMAVALGAVLALADFGLLLARLRKPPTGSRGWLSSMAAGAAATLLWRILRPSLMSALHSHILALGAAVVVSALAVRLLFSRKAGGWIRFV